MALYRHAVLAQHRHALLAQHRHADAGPLLPRRHRAIRLFDGGAMRAAAIGPGFFTTSAQLRAKHVLLSGYSLLRHKNNAKDHLEFFVKNFCTLTIATISYMFQTIHVNVRACMYLRVCSICVRECIFLCVQCMCCKCVCVCIILLYYKYKHAYNYVCAREHACDFLHSLRTTT